MKLSVENNELILAWLWSRFCPNAQWASVSRIEKKIQHATFSNQHVESYEATLQNISSVSEEIDKKFKKSSFESQWEYFERTIFSLLFKTFISSIFDPFIQLADWTVAQILYNFVGMY